MGEVSVNWLKDETRTSLIIVDSDSRNVVQKLKAQSMAFPGNAECVTGFY